MPPLILSRLMLNGPVENRHRPQHLVLVSVGYRIQSEELIVAALVRSELPK